jgi:hypothetical protein
LKDLKDDLLLEKKESQDLLKTNLFERFVTKLCNHVYFVQREIGRF